MRCDEVDPAGHGGFQPFAGAAAARQALRPIGEHRLEHGGVEVLLVGEVVGERRPLNPDVGGDVAEAGVLEAALGEVALGGGDDLGPRSDPVAPTAPGRGHEGAGMHGGSYSAFMEVE